MLGRRFGAQHAEQEASHVRAIYRGVYSSLLDDPDYQRLSANARLVLLTIRLCKDAGAAAIFTCYASVVTAQSGLTEEAVEGALHELETSPTSDRPWIFREGRIVWVRNALRHDPHMRVADPKHRAAIERVLAGLPRSAIVAKFCRYYAIASPFAKSPKGPARPSDDPRGTNPLRVPSTDLRVSSTDTETERGVRPSPAGPPNGHSPAHVVRLDGLREVDL